MLIRKRYKIGYSRASTKPRHQKTHNSKNRIPAQKVRPVKSDNVKSTEKPSILMEMLKKINQNDIMEDKYKVSFSGLKLFLLLIVLVTIYN